MLSSHLSRPLLAAVCCMIVVAPALCSAADTAAETVELLSPKSSGRKVLEIIPGDKSTRARFRMDSHELRQVVMRLLDEDGFRVQPNDAPIGDAGITLKARKKLRSVECEIIPDIESGVSILSFEYARFGSRNWAERALEQITSEIGRHDPIEPPRKRDNSGTAARAESGDKAVISGPQYFDSEVKSPRKKIALPIARLSADPDADGDSAEVVELAIPKQDEPPAANVSSSAEVVTLPGQNTEATRAPATPTARKTDSAEELFRGIQRGDIEESAGRERVSIYLEIRWLDAQQCPTEKARKAFAEQLAAALSLRMLSSKAATRLVECADASLRAQKDAAAEKLASELDTVLKENEVDADQQQMLKAAALGLLPR